MRYSDIVRAGLINLTYDAELFDCFDFAVMVQRVLFDREVLLPPQRGYGARGQTAIGRMSQQLGVRTTTPVDGDIVLTRQFGAKRPAHIGVYVKLDYQPWILHCNDKPFPASRCDRIEDLTAHGLTVEGYYAWKLA